MHSTRVNEKSDLLSIPSPPVFANHLLLPLIMAVDLHTSPPSQFLPDQDHQHLLSSSNKHNNNNNKNKNNHHSAPLKPLAELTHRMPHFMLPHHHTFHFSTIAFPSQDFQSSWDLRPEGSSQEPSPSPPATPQDSCWKTSYDVFGMFANMKLDEKTNSKYHIPGYEINHMSNIGLCSYQSLIQEQIRAIELSRPKQETVVSPKAKPGPYRKSQGQVSEPKQFPKKGNNGRRARPPRNAPQTQLQTGSGMRAVFLDGSDSRCGTGVFLPRGGPTTPSESTNNKQGKGCSTVLIPARVVQALQLHFDQMAATSGPKPAGFPLLHDVLVSNRDGMYSLQKRQSQKAPTRIPNEMILPQEWTY